MSNKKIYLRFVNVFYTFASLEALYRLIIIWKCAVCDARADIVESVTFG
jgi:hypothetical protein